MKREAGNLDLLTGVSHLKVPGFPRPRNRVHFIPKDKASSKRPVASNNCFGNGGGAIAFFSS
jgi:hypothetical protein